MSHDMSFKGSFEYPDKRTARKALKRFLKYECLGESVVQKGDLQVDGEVIRVEYFGSGPASWWETSCGAVETLAELAIAGHVNAENDSGEGEDYVFRVRLLPGGEEEEVDGPFPDGMAPSGGPAGEGPGDVDLAEEFGSACWQGDIQAVRSFLGKGADPHRGVDGAARHPAVLKLLLDAGADPDGRGDPQSNPLCNAARYGELDSVKLLIGAGAALDGSDTGSRATPLMLAAEQLAVPVVRELLKAGADANAKDAEGRTPLMYAVMCSNQEVIEIAAALVEHGADARETDAAGRTVLELARDCLAEDLFREFRRVVSA